MCPICMVAVAMAVAGAGSGGRPLVLAVARLRAKQHRSPDSARVDPKIGVRPKAAEVENEK